MIENITKQKNITIDDIRNIINDEENPVDVFSTNANLIRTMLGRGSFATIQKFLNQIRDEVKGADDDGDECKIDFELNKSSIENIVNIIQTSVNISILEKLNALNENCNDLRENLNIANNDSVELVNEIENLESVINEKDTQIVEITDTLIEREKSYEDEIIALNARLEEAHCNNEKLEAMFEKFMNDK